MLGEDIADVPVDLADHHGDGHVVDDVRRNVVIDGNTQFVRHLNGLRVELGKERVPIDWNHQFEVRKKEIELLGEKNERLSSDDALWKTVVDAR